MSKIEEYIIAQVKKMREQKGMSQAELADLMNVSHSFVGQVESPNYRTKYNFNHINKIAAIFECSPRDFLPEEPFIEWNNQK